MVCSKWQALALEQSFFSKKQAVNYSFLIINWRAKWSRSGDSPQVPQNKYSSFHTDDE